MPNGKHRNAPDDADYLTAHDALRVGQRSQESRMFAKGRVRYLPPRRIADVRLNAGKRTFWTTETGGLQTLVETGSRS